MKRKRICLNEYDYTSPGAYLVTVCASRNSVVFSHILADGALKMNCFGKVVMEEWKRAAQLRDNVELDEYVIMPDHLHGIVVLKCRGTARRAPTPGQFSLPVSSSLPTIVRAFKSAVTRRIHLLQDCSGLTIWQRGYHEHIIRKNENINQVREYIRNNPLRWRLKQGMSETAIRTACNCRKTIENC